MLFVYKTYTFRYRRRARSTSSRDKSKLEEGEDSGGYPWDNELGLEDGDVGEQAPQSAYDLDGTAAAGDDVITFDDLREGEDKNKVVGELEGDGQDDDDGINEDIFVDAREEVLAPLLGEEETPRKKDRKKKRRDRDRGDEGTKGERKKREKEKGERVKGEGKKSRKSRGESGSRKDDKETPLKGKDKDTNVTTPHEHEDRRNEEVTAESSVRKRDKSSKRRSKGKDER